MNKHIVRRLDDKHGRWYTFANGEEKKGPFISVTTPLDIIAKGEGYDRWLGNAPSYDWAQEMSGEARHRGTAMHVAMRRLLEALPERVKIDTREPLTWDEDYWEGDEAPPSKQFIWTPPARRMLEAGILWIVENKPIPETISCELPVYYDSPSFPMGYAGTVDIHCQLGAGKYKGKWIAGDWKCSSAHRFQYPLQIMAYTNALIHMGYKVDVPLVVRLPNWRGKAKNDPRAVQPNDQNVYFEAFMQTCYLWSAINNYPKYTKPRPERLVFSVPEGRPEEGAPNKRKRSKKEA
jgi:hypothetical protein